MTPQPPILPSSLQGLSPPQARFCLAVARFMEKELCLTLAGARILVAFSGGGDSTALLLSLHYLAPKMGFTLIAAHLDHLLRPSSTREAASCRAFADRLGLRCIVAQRDILAMRACSRTGTEETARTARYLFFAETAARQGCDWIATGHTLNDLAEDVLMRLIRGTGWPGMAGMTAVDEKRRLARPLLITPRAGIEAFLTSLGLDWIHDASNNDGQYFRNRVRSAILPLFIRENPAFLDRIAGLWRLGRIDADLFQKLLAPEIGAGGLLPAVRQSQSEDAPEANPMPSPEGEPPPVPDLPASAAFTPRACLIALPKALRLRLYKQKLDALGAGQPGLSGLLALDAAWQRKAEPSRHQFSGGKVAEVTGKGIAWLRHKI